MRKSLLLLTIIFSYCWSYGQKINIEGHKQNIVILGQIDSVLQKQNQKIDTLLVPKFFGTGFLVEIDGFYHLVTAKHVVVNSDSFGNLEEKANGKEIFGFYYDKSGQVQYRSLDTIKKKFKVDWVFHSNPKVDIAIIPFAINDNDNLKIIPHKDFLDTKSIFETYQVYFVSYHPAITNVNDLNPIFRIGHVSRKNKNSTLYIDAFAFPGNSGSPVFLSPSPVRFDSNSFNIGFDPVGDKFIGIIGSYIPYEDVAVSTQTRRPRVIFQENSGLALVWTVDYINEIISSKKMQDQLKHLKTKN